MMKLCGTILKGLINRVALVLAIFVLSNSPAWPMII